MDADGFEFTQFWDGRQIGIDIFQIWDAIGRNIATPSRFLEVGALEGRTTCKVIELFAQRGPIEVTCIDLWEEGTVIPERGLSEYEVRFDKNLALAMGRSAHPVELRKIKADSFLGLSTLIHQGESGRFDWVYVDASHKASDVLGDAVAAFRLLKRGGILIFDDYVWRDPLSRGGGVADTPKPAIDAFVNLNLDQLRLIEGPSLWQLYLQKF